MKLLPSQSSELTSGVPGRWQANGLDRHAAATAGETGFHTPRRVRGGAWGKADRQVSGDLESTPGPAAYASDRHVHGSSFLSRLPSSFMM